jgi:RHS repeat-associated protein
MDHTTIGLGAPTDPDRQWRRDYWISGRSNRSLPATDFKDLPITDPESRFDANGNCLSLPHLDGFEWNYRNNLARAVLVDRSGENRTDDAEYYVYGGDGMRVRKVLERVVNGDGLEITEKIYLDGCEIKRMRSSAGPMLERKTSHITDGSERLALLHQWSEDRLARETHDVTEKRIHYHLANHLGSASLEVNDDGEVISYEEYFPFGGTAFIANKLRDVNLKDYRYSGKERDEATGLYYYGYRYYAPWLGRWISPDPIGPEDGVNSYQFVRNNPVKYIDPDGTQSFLSIDERYPRRFNSPEQEANLRQFMLVDRGLEVVSARWDPSFRAKRGEGANAWEQRGQWELQLRLIDLSMFNVGGVGVDVQLQPAPQINEIASETVPVGELQIRSTDEDRDHAPGEPPELSGLEDILDNDDPLEGIPGTSHEHEPGGELEQVGTPAQERRARSRAISGGGGSPAGTRARSVRAGESRADNRPAGNRSRRGGRGSGPVGGGAGSGTHGRRRGGGGTGNQAGIGSGMNEGRGVGVAGSGTGSRGGSGGSLGSHGTVGGVGVDHTDPTRIASPVTSGEGPVSASNSNSTSANDSPSRGDAAAGERTPDPRQSIGSAVGSASGLERSSGAGGLAIGSNRSGSRLGIEGGSSAGSLLSGGEGGTQPASVLDDVVSAAGILQMDFVGYDPNDSHASSSGVPSGAFGLIDFGEANKVLYLGGAVAGLFGGAMLSRLFGRLRQFFRVRRMLRNIANQYSEILSAAPEAFGDLLIWGRRQRVGDEYAVHILLIRDVHGTPIGQVRRGAVMQTVADMRSYVRLLEGETRAAGASSLRIYGHLVENEHLLNPRLSRALGFGANVIELSRTPRTVMTNLKPVR